MSLLAREHSEAGQHWEFGFSSSPTFSSLPLPHLLVLSAPANPQSKSELSTTWARICSVVS